MSQPDQIARAVEDALRVEAGDRTGDEIGCRLKSGTRKKFSNLSEQTDENENLSIESMCCAINRPAPREAEKFFDEQTNANGVFPS